MGCVAEQDEAPVVVAPALDRCDGVDVEILETAGRADHGAGNVERRGPGRANSARFRLATVAASGGAPAAA